MYIEVYLQHLNIMLCKGIYIYQAVGGIWLGKLGKQGSDTSAAAKFETYKSPWQLFITSWGRMRCPGVSGLCSAVQEQDHPVRCETQAAVEMLQNWIHFHERIVSTTAFGKLSSLSFFLVLSMSIIVVSRIAQYSHDFRLRNVSELLVKGWTFLESKVWRNDTYAFSFSYVSCRLVVSCPPNQKEKVNSFDTR